MTIVHRTPTAALARTHAHKDRAVEETRVRLWLADLKDREEDLIRELHRNRIQQGDATEKLTELQRRPPWEA